jgi:Pyruvate/2-oxoacid:ferredoxin oxidoreductase delta subunit
MRVGIPDLKTQTSRVGVLRLWAAIGFVGLGIMLFALTGYGWSDGIGMVVLSLVLMSVGVMQYARVYYRDRPAGIQNDGVWFGALTSRGHLAWVVGLLLTGFYVVLYWFPALLGLGEEGEANRGLIGFFDPLSHWIKGKPASEWFVYGVLYTLAILVFGAKFILKYRHSRHQLLRTISVMFFQLIFAFLLPEILMSLNLPYNDFKNIWPLNYYFFFDWNLRALLDSGAFGMFTLIWGIALVVLISPVLAYFFGKRWYCSWVCGCGGLAETAGDPFRHLSDNSLRAWQWERWLVHGVLVFAVVMTGLVLYTWFTGSARLWFLDSYQVRSWYGFLIGAMFSGVIGVGFYPLMGSRVWCRFGCPMAAVLGIQQKYFSRFRITTNGGQCISCGNCSTYCEMGIDVRWYAQRGQDIVRASCVGCGICSAVCPRGVLRLENGTVDLRDKASDLRI